MHDYLVEHALSNVWCTPDQDYQFIFRPARLTGERGALAKFKIEWETYALPTTNEVYHVYQIGQINRGLLGIMNKKRGWQSFANMAMEENMVVDLYTVDGIQVSRSEAFFLVTDHLNVIVAIKNIASYINLSQNPIFLRLYSNAYFASDRADPVHDKVVVSSYIMRNQNELLTFQRSYHDHQLLTGHTYLFHNGRLVHDIVLSNVAMGDRFEFVYDSTVRLVVDIPISSMETFISDLDSKHKYIAHLPKETVERIEYKDDIDFWLIKKDGTKFSGVYYHKNNLDSVRMITHKDYALPVAYVTGYADTVDPTEIDVNNLTLRMHVRHSGYDRPLVNEHHRIKELYKLSDTDIVRAMSGLDSTVSVWEAAVLESSAYTQIMRSRSSGVTEQVVQDAYGYNAMGIILANTPTKLVHEDALWVADIAPLLRGNSTVYEYDSKGILLGVHNHANSSQYVARNTKARLIEAFVGIGGERLATIYDTVTSQLKAGFNYRFYKTPLVDNSPINAWEVAVEGVDYQISNNVVTWLLDRQQWYSAVLSDERFLAYSFTTEPLDELIQFSILAEEQRTNGVWYRQVCEIPVGQLDLYLNGKALIENLDYYVRWPEVIVTNKKYLVDGSQTITVRGYGFAQSDFTRDPVEEVGWVKHGLLSRNRRFDIRDDRVMRIVVGGGVVDRSALRFAEDHSGVYLDGPANGTPYVINDIIIPVDGVNGETGYDLRAISQAVDTEISDYLTLKLPEPEIAAVNGISERYPIFSPFCSKIIHDFINGFLNPPEITGQYSEADIKRILTDYEWLLNYDPCRLGVDTRYVSIHPHNRLYVIELTIYQYMFMERVIRYYLDNKVDLSSFIVVKEGWL